MKIIFLCGSIEPGKDGVGDYTRRLCGELIRTGHQVQILSLCDKQAIGFFTQTQMIEETPVTVRRIPIASSYNQRLAWTQEVLNEVAPDWISLQFVTYSFNSKGLPFWLPKFLRGLKGTHQWHIMFHELWLGIFKEPDLKERIVGWLQKKIIFKLFKNNFFQAKHTNSQIYKKILDPIVSIAILELFGNCPVLNDSIINTRKDTITFIHFGTINKKMDSSLFLNYLQTFFKKIKKDFKIIFVGGTGDKINDWIEISQELNIKLENYGCKSESEISKILGLSHIGLTTYETMFVEKSGAAACMREHGLPILSAREIEKPKNEVIEVEYLHYYNSQSLEYLLKIIQENPKEKTNLIDKVSSKFLSSLN
jgi:hypothetical protein